MNLVYIDDVVDEMIAALNGNEHCNENFCEVPVTHTRTLGEIVEIIRSFKDMPANLGVADMGDGLAKKLYSTYLTYLPKERFAYP